MRVVVITGKLNVCDGVTTYLFHLINHLMEKCEIILICANGDALNEFINLKVRIILIEEIDIEKRKLVSFGKVILKVARVIRKYKPHIIHSNNYYNASIAKYSSCFLMSRSKLVQTIHSDYQHSGILKKYNADRYILVNMQLMRIVTTYDKRLKDKSHVVFNGIDFDEIISPMNQLIGSNLRIVTAARLIKSKGIHIIIKALYYLRIQYGIETSIHIYGEGEYHDYLFSLTKRLNVEAYFHGSENDKNKIYRNGDIFIFSSLVDSFGLTLLEAANYQNFVIASDFVGIENILQDKIEGLIYKRQSYQDLAEKIRLAINIGYDCRRKIANVFREKAIRSFSALRMADETLEVYKWK